MFEVAIEAGICQLSAEGTRWLATGIDGGFSAADRAVNVTVPTGFDRTDLAAYVVERCEAAGIPTAGPALLTAVEQTHGRGARAGPVTVVATAGLSNPATLPVGAIGPAGAADGRGESADRDSPPVGTVNLLVGSRRSLEDAALASLLATVVEAKTATLQSLTGFTGTTSDAVAVGCATDGEPTTFAGSATDLGDAARACVREAVRASLESYYEDREVPETVADAQHGAVTTRRATVFEP